MNEEMISLLTKLNDNIETGFKDVNLKIDKVETGFKDVNLKIDKVETGFKDVNIKMDKLETGFKDVNMKIDKLETGFKDVNMKIDRLETSVKSLEGTITEGFTGIGKTFEEATKANNELESSLNVDIDYLMHKILQIEKDIFVLSPKH